MGAFCFRGTMADKEFKTIDQQIDLLMSRGLSVPDREVAADFLLRNNYYRVSGYSLTLRSHDVFYEDASFQNIIDIYNFDYELRHILLHYIELIEVLVKSVYSYEFAKIHGGTGYLNPSLFTCEERYQKIMNKAEEQKKTRLPHEAYLKHFVEDLKQDIPLWAFVDLLTISDISKLYSITEKQIQDDITKDLGLTIKSDLTGQFLHSMTIIRNLCAHGSRLYNRLFEQKPKLKRKDFMLLREEEDGSRDNAHLFGFILIMRQLMKPEEFSAMKAEIEALTDRIPYVDMKYYGFCDNWKEIL